MPGQQHLPIVIREHPGTKTDAHVRWLPTGRCDRITAAWEMLAQFVGGLCGGILLKLSLPHT
jgi:hypothetical protein